LPTRLFHAHSRDRYQRDHSVHSADTDEHATDGGRGSPDDGDDGEQDLGSEDEMDGDSDNGDADADHDEDEDEDNEGEDGEDTGENTGSMRDGKSRPPGGLPLR